MDPTHDRSDRRRLLRIYLNDHLMGSAGGIELCRRCLRSNHGTPLGAFLTDLLLQIIEDRRSLEDLMARMGFPVDRLKLVAAAAGEKVGRLKLNGQLLGYSDLSRLLELEGLYAGVTAKQRLWLSLREIASSYPQLSATDFDQLVERAASQLEGLEQHRREAARTAFGAPARTPEA